MITITGIYRKSTQKYSRQGNIFYNNIIDDEVGNKEVTYFVSSPKPLTQEECTAGIQCVVAYANQDGVQYRQVVEHPDPYAA